MGSVYEEITRLETAKADIETAIEGCGVNVPDTDLISKYALYIRKIPSAVFSELNVDSVGGEDQYIKTIKLENGLINATTGGLVSSAGSGLAPKIGTSASSIISTQSDEWVLTSTKGGSPTWRKLPSNAFLNDNTNTTYSLSGTLSGNTYITTLTDSNSNRTTATIPCVTGASTNSNGKAGLVPAPTKNKLNQCLCSDGSWQTLNIRNYYSIDASKLDTTKFYPVIIARSDIETDCEVHSPNVSGTSPYNQNVIHFILNDLGWTDTPKNFKMIHQGVYDINEITIGAVGAGTQNGDQCVWVRGGLVYRFYCNKEPILYKEGYTTGNEVYSVGANYSGGTNSKVTIYWTYGDSSQLLAVKGDITNYYWADQKIAISANTATSPTVNLLKATSGVQIGNTADYGWYLNNSRICAGNGTARGVNVGSLLISSAWADYTKVPTNGIYSKGTIKTNGNIHPLTNNTKTLGTSSYRWASLYTNNVYSNTIYNGTNIYAANKEIIHADDDYFELNKGYSNVMWFNAREYKFKVGSSGVLVMISPNGNVGIGNVGGYPAYKLHVGDGEVMADTYHAWTGGFKKNGSSDDYMLLGGGGHKLLRDFAIASHTHSYLPLSGGTMTGNITYNTDSHGIYFYNNCGIEKWSGYGPCLVAEGNSTNFFIRKGTDRTQKYKIYHEGNLTKSNINLGNVQNTAFYQRVVKVNGTGWNMAGTTNSAAFTIYAPITAGTSGQVLKSTGGTPGWGSVTWADVTGKPETFAPSSHTHNYLGTPGDKRNESTTPDSYVNKLIFQGLKTKETIGSPSSDTYSYLLGLRGWAEKSGGNSWELAFNNTGIFARTGATTVWGSWERILTNGNSSVSGGGNAGGSSITVNIGGTGKTLTIPTSLPADGGNADTVDTYHIVVCKSSDYNSSSANSKTIYFVY